MDWGLFNKNAGEYMFLREEIVYDNTVSFIRFFSRIIYDNFFSVFFFFCNCAI